MDAPVITIFVRHSATCKYAGDEFCKRCSCKKHLRWTLNGKQFRRKTGQRSWAGAEDAKRDLEDQLSGKAPIPEPAVKVLLFTDAVSTFISSKTAQGVKPYMIWMYTHQLKRLRAFCERRGFFTLTECLTLENLIAFRATWPEHYKSSNSRAVVQKCLLVFARFCYNAGWVERVPKLSPIKIDQPDTEPLTEDEYNRLMEATKGKKRRKLRTIIKLMRWSGLAVRDASTLKRTDLQFNDESGMYRIVRERTKTGADLYIPIPKEVAEDLLAVLNGNPEYVFWDRQSNESEEFRQSRSISQRISEIFDKAKVKSAGHMVSHRLRATYAVDMLQKGVPLEHVSKLLGHRSVTTTERHYAKWVKGRQDQLDSIVSASWGKK